MLEIKKELLFDHKCRVIDAMSQVSNRLMSTLSCTPTYSELCEFYLNLDHMLKSIERELSIIDCPLKDSPVMKNEDIPNV